MESKEKLMCPVHKTEIVSYKTIFFSNTGKSVQEPLFYCEKCDKYYVHTNMTPYGSKFDYGNKQVINTIEEKYVTSDMSESVICTDISKLRYYSAPFIPEICYKDQSKLIFVSSGLLCLNSSRREITGYYCEKCGDFYLDESDYDEIQYEFEKEFAEIKSISGKTKINSCGEAVSRYRIEYIRPKADRKKTEDIVDIIGSYEDCEKNYDTSFPYSLLHYAFVFRRFDAALKIIEGFDKTELQEALHFKGPNRFEWITPLVCAKWNLNYILAFDERNNTGLAKMLADYFCEVEHIEELMEYTDSIDQDDDDVFSVFWGVKQPMLDVIYYEKQVVASRQVRNKGFSIVMDEVGTGKTVSALYTIRDIIQEKNEQYQKAKILIVCPYNKREDWQSDIRRQLGRYAHIVEQGDDGKMYLENLKQIFFNNDEQIIFIAGQKQGSDKDGSYSALKGTIESYSREKKWDLVVIDEAHISFNNYFGITAEKTMLMTATPIVVNAGGKRSFDDYLELIRSITGIEKKYIIEPIIKAVPSDFDVYVNWFREDMEKDSAERRIRFVSCKRWAERDDIFYQIKDKKGALTALQYDQDDDYLYMAATDIYGLSNVHKPRKNAKIDRLIALLHENNKSYIIFCEHQYIVDRVFTALKDEFSGIVVAEKYGKFENQYGLDNVQDGQLVNTLMQVLRNNERVLFVTTGKTGGTGLNLGEFSGVIHYELPFTSIELEQRFGRVDRMDTIEFDKSKDMIFMLNECHEDENDMEINRMLYYCTTKVDVTCQYMPIRNTVLYYPEFIKRNGKAIRESLDSFKKEYVLSEQNEKNVKKILRNIRQFEKKIKNDSSWKYVESLDKNTRLSALKALSNARDERISEAYYELLHDYLEYWKKTKPERSEYQKIYKLFLDAKKNVYNWLAIIGLISVNKNNDIFVGYESKDDGDEGRITQVLEKIIDGGHKSNKTVQQQILEIINLIDKCVFDDDELKSFSSDGIFCYKDGMIYRSSVKRYREGIGWN